MEREKEETQRKFKKNLLTRQKGKRKIIKQYLL